MTSDAPRNRRPGEASAPLLKAKVLVRFAKAQLPSPAGLANKVPFPFRAPTTPGGVEPLPAKKRTGADYDTQWARRPIARATRHLLVDALVRPLANSIADPEICGADRLDGLEGPVIFTPNHHSHLDTPLMLASLPYRFRHKVFAAAAADYFFANQITGAASALVLNAVPLERSKISRRSADESAELIDDGWSMLIFPEGGRSPDGWGQSFKAGAAYLSVRCGVPVVPVHVFGTDRLLPKGSRKLKAGSTRITFGDPIYPEADTDSRAFGRRIELAVAALGDESTSDWYSARVRLHAEQTPALTGPDTQTWRRAWQLGARPPLRHGRRPKSERTWP